MLKPSCYVLMNGKQGFFFCSVPRPEVYLRWSGGGAIYVPAPPARADLHPEPRLGRRTERKRV